MWCTASKVTLVTLKICFFLVLAFVEISNAQDGWKMTDRFHGFRYELVGANLDQTVASAIISQADANGCFGWVQLTPDKSLVGEARCSKQRGKAFEDWLTNLKNVNTNTLVYEDTKIRLHFSHFKLLESGRDTCFLDAPHQCKAYKRRDKDRERAPKQGSSQVGV